VTRRESPLAKVTLPEKSPRDWLIASLVFGLSALHFGFFYNYTLVNGDEGIILQGAQRILQGQVLYRDFFAFITPGSYYWIAFFFKIFGSSIEVGRAVLLVEGALLSVLTYLLARRVCSRWSAFLASILVTLTALPNRFIVLHNWDSTFWACLTLYCAVFFLQYPGRLLLFATGWFAALTCLFEQSKGGGIVVGLTLGFVIVLATDRGIMNRWKAVFWPYLIAGFALPFLLTVSYFAAQHGLTQMLADWFWPLHNYTTVNKTSYGFVPLSSEDRSAIYDEPLLARLLMFLVMGPWFIVPALPLLAAGVLLYWTPKRWRKSTDENARVYYVVMSAAIVGLFLAILATGRPDFTHFNYVAPILFVVLAWIIDGQMVPAIIRRALPLATFVVIFCCLGFGLALLTQPLNARYTLDTRRGTLKATHSDEIVEYVQRNIPAGKTVLFYPYLPLYYYLTATSSPGRYEYLMAGFHTAAQFQDGLRELAADRTEMVFFEPTFHEKAALVFPGVSGGATHDGDAVAEYISSHYRSCAALTSQDFWHFLAMVRRDLPCP